MIQTASRKEKLLFPSDSELKTIMTKKEFADRMAQIDPESPNAPSELAVLFEEDYLTTGKDLNDPETVDNLRDTAENDLNYFMQKYDHLLQRINDELRKAGATEVQITWGLFGDVELPTFSYFRCNIMAKKLIRLSYQITYCLGELKMLSRYTDVDQDELNRIQREYRRRFG